MIEPLGQLGDLADSLLPALIAGATSFAFHQIRLGLHTPNEGWTVEVLRRATRWRDDRVVYFDECDNLGEAIDHAHTIAGQVIAGIGRLHW